MPEIQPFCGVHYNTSRVNPADVLTQPYDKITPQMQQRYYELSPYNLIRIELGKDEPGDNESNNKYTRARACYRQWLASGILTRSASPAFYFLEQTFDSPNGTGRRTRQALIARVRLHRWDEGEVLPHEHTLSKPKADRMALLRSCQSQQGQIFMLHPEPIPAPKLGAPLYELVDDYRVTNRVYEITDAHTIRSIQTAILPQKLYIADGHHRYETALAYRDEQRQATGSRDRNAPHEFVMATLVDMNDPGLIVLPTHRVVSNLAGFDAGVFASRLRQQFEVTRYPSLPAMLDAIRPGGHRVGIVDASGFAVVTPRDVKSLEPLFAGKPPLWHTLDVAILHVAILESLLGIDEKRLREESNVTYWREAEKVVEMVRAGQAQLGFFLSPTPVRDVKAIADARSRMPQKSTDFYPKLLSGMIINDLQST
jgi:uncharacterized protein (DUF1015 family)